MKKFMTTFLICLLLSGSWSVNVSAMNTSFEDVTDGAYYYDAVIWAVEKNITYGLSENLFGTESTCTRAQAVTFLWRAQDCPQPETTQVSFQDITQNAYYYEAVLWAVENGIVSGYNETTFAPDDTVSRAQFVTFFHRLKGNPESSIMNPFEDISPNAYYYHAVLWAYENGITSGVTLDHFMPETGCTRTQAVTLLWKTIEVQEVNARDYGVSTENTGQQNSIALQRLIDTLSETRGTIYIPAGEYEFAANGTQTIGSHCIKMKSNVSIKGDGNTTILKPTGHSEKGMDMFYYNEYNDTGRTIFLMNCKFEDFVIDASSTSCTTYTSAGKGFMFNLFRNCHWKNVMVKSTDATGFGVDCPINSSIVDCIAINCGKAATTTDVGASGFGIGFGYSEDENLLISNCQASGNKKFGFFFEHQRRFNRYAYTATHTEGFIVSDCEASGNLANFGGIQTTNTTYKNCSSKNALKHGYLFENSKNCNIFNCHSENETDTSFVILQSDTDGGTQEVQNISYEQCESKNSKYGVKVVTYGSTKVMSGNVIKDCRFYSTQTNDIFTSGKMEGLTLTGNISDLNMNSFDADIENFVNVNNSWN